GDCEIKSPTPKPLQAALPLPLGRGVNGFAFCAFSHFAFCISHFAFCILYFAFSHFAFNIR
ncbi:MAG: hypothetical protein SPE63_09355, partial [Prevotella sp.]|nr:hypothetical protein [Prevotella sp.]